VRHFLHRADRSVEVVIVLPDGSPQVVPLAWTDRAEPDPHRLAVGSPAALLSGLALLELLDRIASWERSA
jgi:hypothetical protein